MRAVVAIGGGHGRPFGDLGVEAVFAAVHVEDRRDEAALLAGRGQLRDHGAVTGRGRQVQPEQLADEPHPDADRRGVDRGDLAAERFGAPLRREIADARRDHRCPLRCAFTPNSSTSVRRRGVSTIIGNNASRYGRRT